MVVEGSDGSVATVEVVGAVVGGLVVGGTVVSGGACVVGVVVWAGGEVGAGLG